MIDHSGEDQPVLGDPPPPPDEVWARALDHALDPWAVPDATLVPSEDLPQHADDPPGHPDDPHDGPVDDAPSAHPDLAAETDHLPGPHTDDDAAPDRDPATHPDTPGSPA